MTDLRTLHANWREAEEYWSRLFRESRGPSNITDGQLFRAWDARFDAEGLLEQAAIEAGWTSDAGPLPAWVAAQINETTEQESAA